MDGVRERAIEEVVDLHSEPLPLRHLVAIAREQAPRVRGGRRSLIQQTVEREVLPRLVLAHRAAQRRAAGSSALDLGAHVDELVRRVLANDPEGPVSFVAEQQQAGLPADAIYLDLLAPAARCLGCMWEEDACDFTQVTVGLGRLHHLVRAFSVAFHGAAPAAELGHDALLVPAPGEQHTLGLAMVTEFFRRGGWTVWSGAPDEPGVLLDIVRRHWFSVIGFSLASIVRVDALATAIRRVRRASCNPAVGIMVGGPVFLEQPELATALGADATATDARHAVEQARGLVKLLAQRG